MPRWLIGTPTQRSYNGGTFAYLHEGREWFKVGSCFANQVVHQREFQQSRENEEQAHSKPDVDGFHV